MLPDWAKAGHLNRLLETSKSLMRVWSAIVLCLRYKWWYPDTTICNGGTKQLRTIPSLNFCWSPITYLDDPLLPNPVTSTPKNITYYFIAEVTGKSIITNGNFNGGNTGFTSQYNFAN